MAVPLAASDGAADRRRAQAWNPLGRWRASAPLLRALQSRVALTLMVCGVVSTQVVFQPDLFTPFIPQLIALRWLEYAGECAIMGFAVMVGATLAEAAAARLPRLLAGIAVGVGLTAGAILGALLLIPYFDLPADSAFDYRFIGDCLYWLAIGSGIALIYALQRRAARASEALHQAEVDHVALSKQMLEAQLQLMRAQVEPHFLFNTLANVKRLCQTDVQGGVTMLNNLLRYLRAALPHMREPDTTLGQEVDLVQAYLALLKIRMGPRLRFAIDVPPELRNVAFPPVMILTLAENAIKHGLNPSEHGGAIGVRATLRDGRLVVRVADTGVGFGGAATGGTGVGLANTRARLAAIFGEGASLELEANEPSGVLAVIEVPLSAVSRVPAIESARAVARAA